MASLAATASSYINWRQHVENLLGFSQHPFFSLERHLGRSAPARRSHFAWAQFPDASPCHQYSKERPPQTTRGAPRPTAGVPQKRRYSETQAKRGGPAVGPSTAHSELQKRLKNISRICSDPAMSRELESSHGDSPTAGYPTVSAPTARSSALAGRVPAGRGL